MFNSDFNNIIRRTVLKPNNFFSRCTHVRINNDFDHNTFFTQVLILINHNSSAHLQSCTHNNEIVTMSITRLQECR